MRPISVAVTSAALTLAVAYGSVCAETLTILTPDMPRVESDVAFRNDESLDVTLGPFEDESGRTRVEMPMSEKDRECRVRTVDVQTDKLAKATLTFGDASELTCTFSEQDFFTPHTLRLGLVTKQPVPVPSTHVRIIDHSGRPQEITLGGIDQFEVVEFEDVHPGPVAVEVAVGSAGAEHTDIFLTDSQRAHYIPLLVDGEFSETDRVYRGPGIIVRTEDGEPDGELFFGVSILLFVITLVIWAGGTSVLALLPTSVGVAGGSRMRRATVFAMLMSGLVLLGNGVALLAVGDAAYLAVVTAIAAVQLVATSWLGLAMQARHATLTSAGTVAVVAAFAASVLFLPALTVEQAESSLGTQMSIVQVILVTLAIGVLVAARLRDRMADDTAKREKILRKRRTTCEVCGERIHPVFGTCGCTVVASEGDGRIIGRLQVKSGTGAMQRIGVRSITTIGASAKCDLCLNADPLIAANHCVVFERGKDICIRDAPESSGTYVNGERIAERTLSDGDEIRVGDSWLMFETG